MKRALCLGGALALFTAAGFAGPAAACRDSRPVFTAEPARGQAVRVRVDQVLLIGGQVGGGPPGAVRATVLSDSAVARRGDSIVIVISSGDHGNCYYGGLADRRTISGDGALEGYASLARLGDSSDTFSAFPATDFDRRRYAVFLEDRLRGRWARARFTSAGGLSE